MNRNLTLGIILAFVTLATLGIYYFFSIKIEYELSEKCSKSAREHYKSTGYNGLLSGYENHYNKNLNECFSLVSDLSDSGNTKGLVAINENKTIGLYMASLKNELIFCHVNKKECGSLDEWKLLTKSYMEQ